MDANSNPVLTNVNVINNEVGSTGGGVHIRESSPTFNSSSISGNFSGGSGGGISNFDGEPTFNQVIFGIAE